MSVLNGSLYSRVDRLYPKLNALEAAMLAAQAGGIGRFVVRVTPRPKNKRYKAMYQSVLSQEQWNNILEKIRMGKVRIYGVHRIEGGSAQNKPETLNPV
jgi:hypothetical protein